MKETPIFEEIVMRLARQPGFALCVLVGGLLSFIPVVNFFAFGYLYRVALVARRSGKIVLPAFSDWRGLFLDGCRFVVPWLAYFMIPVGLAVLVSWFFIEIGFSFISILLVSITLLIAPLIFCSALYRLQTRSDLKDLLDVTLIFRMTWSCREKLIVPAFVFLGLFLFRFPFYGFIEFFGFLMLITYSSFLFRSIAGTRD